MKRSIAIFCLSLLLFGCSSDDKSVNPANNDDPFNPGDYQLAGQIFYNNDNITEQTSTRATFWLRDETTGSTIDSATIYYDATTGNYGINHLPNSLIGISASIHETGQDETLPGNYRSWTTVDLATLSTGEAQSYRLDVCEILHLLEPFDNSAFGLLEMYPQHASPVTFRWETIEGASRYDLVISEYSDSPYGYLNTLVTESISTATYVATLDPSSEDTHYEFYVNAYNTEGVRIAYYMTTYSGAYGWDYRFVVPN